MREIHTEAGLHIGKAIDNLLAHAQTEDCFTTFNGICLPANRLTTKEELWQKYDDAMDERSRKYEQRREAEQRQRYTAPLRKRIEGLIADLEVTREQAIDRYNECNVLADADSQRLAGLYFGKRLAYNSSLDRLRAILSDSDASEAEKGSESSVGEG